MIKIDIEMPRTCNGCFACYDIEFCNLMDIKYPDNKVEEHCYNDTKPEWCPLIEEKGE